LTTARGFFPPLALFWAAGLLAVSPALASTSPEPGARRNHLAAEASPYLQMHVYNPVDWYPWGPEALERARREDKPIFLSVGYSTCYWCHVMERQVFSDPAIAKQMNDSFVNIKVDREERPDIDTVYMQATHILTGSGGWPNSLFLTPDGIPFFAGTYFPPADAPGRPGFPSVLSGIAASWKNDRAEVVARAQRVAATLERNFASSGAPQSSFDPGLLLASGAAGLARRYDPSHGGFSRRTKFPSPYQLELLLAAYRQGSSPRALDMLTKTLDEMALGGINDQLGGGFHRYSTEPTWSVPHFEKMLYDNAQLLPLYARAYRETKNPLYAQVARTIGTWMLRDMAHPLGGFYSALDAEVDAVEGASYVWTSEQLRAVLGQELTDALLSVYELVPVPGEESPAAGALRVRLPVEPAVEHWKAKDVAALLDGFAGSRGALLAVRDERKQPLRDEKVLAGWNGLAIRGLVDAGVALEEPRYVAAAARAARYVQTFLRDADGRLARSHVVGLAREEAVLDDYAFVADGLLALHDATGEPRWLASARALADRMLAEFEGPPGVGFYLSVASSGTDALFVRPRVLRDNVTPSGNTVAVRVLLALASQTGDARYAEAAERTLAALAPILERSPEFAGTAVTALATAPTKAAPLARKLSDAPRRAALPSLPTGKDYVQAAVERIGESRHRARVRVEITRGWHVNANPASLAFLIPTRVELVGPSGMAGPEPRLLSVVYPRGAEYRPRFSPQPLSVYEGDLGIDVELPEPLSPDARLALTFQACDATTCLRPETLELEIP